MALRPKRKDVEPSSFEILILLYTISKTLRLFMNKPFRCTSRQYPIVEMIVYSVHSDAKLISANCICYNCIYIVKRNDVSARSGGFPNKIDWSDHWKFF